MIKPIKLDKAVDTGTTDLFISHSSIDKEFARRLRDALKDKGKLAWFDEWRMEGGDLIPEKINTGIERAQIFLFVLSPASLKSEWCQSEVLHAAKCNKRVITILHNPIEFDASNQAHQILKNPLWIDFYSTKMTSEWFEKKIEHLMRKLNEDKDYLEKHSQFLIRALDWQRDGYRNRALLPAGIISVAKTWLRDWDKKVQTEKFPEKHSDAPTDLHRSYIDQSDKHIKFWRLVTTVIIFTGMTILGGLGIKTFQEQQNRKIAENINHLEEQGSKALDEFKFNRINGLLAAMEAGGELQKLMKETGRLDYLAGSPVYALNTMLSQLKNQTLLSHPSVSIVKFNARGNRILTGGNDGVIRVWNTSGKMIAHIKADSTSSPQINNASFNAQGDRIITAFSNQSVKIWDSESGKLITEVKETASDLSKVSFSPDGKLFVTVLNNQNAHIWDISGKLVAKLKADEKPVVQASFNNQGDHIITVDDRGHARLWNLSGHFISELRSDYFLLESIQLGLNPKKEQIIVTSMAGDHGSEGGDVLGDALLWDISGVSKKSVTRLRQNRYPQGIKRFSFSKNGKYLVTLDGSTIVGGGGVTAIWDTSGKLITRLNIDGNKDKNIKFLSADFMSQKDYVVTTHNDGIIRVWDSSGKVVRELQENKENDLPEKHVTFSPDGNLLAVASSDTIRLWNLSRSEAQEEIKMSGFKYGPERARFSPTGDMVVTTDEVLPVHLWTLSGKLIAKFEPGCSVTDAGFNNTGQKVITICEKTPYTGGSITVTLWSISGEFIRSTEVPDSDASNFYFDFKNNYLGLNSLGKRLNSIQEIADEFGIKKIDILGDNSIRGGELRPDIDLYLTRKDDSAQLLSFRGQTIHDFQKFSSGEDMRLSHNGKTIAVTSWGRTNPLLLDQSGKQIAELKGHTNGVRSVDFSPTNDLIVTASSDNTAKVWTLSGKLIAELKGHQSSVFEANFNSTGDKIITASGDSTARIWKVKTLDQLLAEGCNFLRPYLDNNPEASQKLKSCQAVLTK